MEVASTTTLLSPGERVRRGTSLRWRLMSQTELEKRVVARPRYSPRAVDQGSVAGARTDGQRVIACHVCYSNRTNSRGDSDGIPAGMNGETRDNDGQPVKCFQYQQFQPSQRIFTRTDEHYITLANIVLFPMILLIKGHIDFQNYSL